MTVPPPDPPPPDSRDDRVLLCVRAALRRMVAGQPVDLTQICAADPELEGAVADALALRASLPALSRFAATDPLVGMVLGDRYTLESQLGRGGMGAVYAARDNELQRDVAIKVLDRHRFFDPITERRFLREAEVLATLQHPSVVPVHDRGEHPALLYLVMDRLEGATLGQILAATTDRDDPAAAASECLGAPLEHTHWQMQACAWCAHLAEGIAEAHRHGILHRDVKPANAFVRRDGRAVVLDFGIAHRASDGDLTGDNHAPGTPWYMAPEQAWPDSPGDGATAERQPLGPAVDVYGLTATLYHLITGRPPFGGNSTAALERLRREDPPPASDFVPGLPRDLRAILDKGLERNPANRYPTAAHLAADLHAFLQHQPVSVRPLGPLQRRWRRIRRAPARYVATAATVVAVTTALVALPYWLAESARHRQTQKLELLATLPHLLAFEGDPEQRLIDTLRPERDEHIAVLDRILELDPDDVPMRLFRAALQQDQGRHAAAAADLEAAEVRAPTPYLRELARRYGDSDRNRAGILAVDLSGLPDPESPQDLFAAGFHQLRQRHVPGYGTRAFEILRRAADDYLPARDLELIAIIAAGEEQGSLQMFQQAYDKAVMLEERYGRPTARTLAVRAVALLVQRRYAEAEPLLLESLRLRPDRHGPLTNLGVVYRRLDRPHDALRHLQRAHELRPHFWNTTHTLAQVHMDLGDFDRARKLAEQIPPDGASGAAWKRASLLADIDFNEAASLVSETASAQALERSRDLGRRAAAGYGEAMALAPPSRHGILTNQRNAARNLANSDNSAALADLIRSVSGTPTPHQLANIASFLPERGLDEDGVLWLRLLLRSLAIDLAVGDPAFRERQAQYLEHTRAALSER